MPDGSRRAGRKVGPTPSQRAAHPCRGGPAMPTLARRVVVLLTTLTLLLGVAGGAAPAAFAAKPVAPSTVLRGIDVDASTIPQLQRLMDRHKLTAVQLTQF